MSARLFPLSLGVCWLFAAGLYGHTPESQSIAPFHYRTPHYELSVFSAGHFAIKIGGLWMPGCICLNINGTPQYRQEALSHLAAHVTRTSQGREMIITGRLAHDFAFTQTLVMTAQAVELTYVVEALAATRAEEISVTASPQLDQAAGRLVVIETAHGQQEFVFPPAQPVDVADARSITWRDLSQRDGRTTFVTPAQGQISFRAQSGLYKAVLVRRQAVQRGDKFTAVLRFEAVPIGEAAQLQSTFHGQLRRLRFGVSGLSGLLHNVRTERGLLIQYVSLNEDDVHQVQVGRGKGAPWGGVYVPAVGVDMPPWKEGESPGQPHVMARGRIVSDWTQHVQGSLVSPTEEAIHWSAERTQAQGKRQTRVLFYMPQWLEQEQTPFLIRCPDGRIVREERGRRLYFGLLSHEEEEGLGPYQPLGEFPAGTEIIVPMLERGEELSIRTGQAGQLCLFRFDIYFRGFWLQTLDREIPRLYFEIRLRRLEGQQVGPLTLVADRWQRGHTALNVGGMPLLSMRTLGGEEPLAGQWHWRMCPRGAEGQLFLDTNGKPAALSLRVSAQLLGRRLTYQSGKRRTDVLAGVPLRFGMEKDVGELAAGALLFAPSAIERVTLHFASPIHLRFGAGGEAWLRCASGPLKIILRYERLEEPPADEIAHRPAPPQPPRAEPFAGLSVLRDQPRKGDVTIRSPYWEIVHAAAMGGAICSLRFFYGTGRNIFRQPVETALWAPEKFSDLAERRPQIEIVQATPALVQIRVTGQLRNAAGRALCPFEHLYLYRPMLVRRTCRYDLGQQRVVCRRLELGSLHLQPWLDEAATRGATERTSWHHAIFPGAPVFVTDDFSQYLCLFRRGVEGIDWLPACDLDQWRGLGGKDHNARYGIIGDDAGNPEIVIEPVGWGREPVELTGRLCFEAYHSLPQVKRYLPRRHFVVCLNTGEAQEELLRLCAAYGATDILLLAGNTPGTFALSDLQACRQVVQQAHKYGLRVYAFDPFQLVNRQAPLWQEHHEEFAREEIRDGKSVPAVFSDYGDYFCPQAEGFRQALQDGYRRLVASAGFDGLYHDFTHPYVCTNTRHWPKPHLNTDGVLEMILWDRQFLGPARIFCGHTGWTPVLFFQDLCDVTAIFEEYPASEPLPLHLTPAQGEFINAAQPTLVSSFLYYGAAAPGEEGRVPVPSELVTAYLSRCALTGLFPWAHAGNLGAEGLYDLPELLRPWLRLFALRGKNDLGTMQFLPSHRQTAVLSANPFIRAATYWNKDTAIIVLGNSEAAETQAFEIIVRPEAFGWPPNTKIQLRPTRDCPPLQALEGNRFRGRLPGYDWAAYEAKRLTRPEKH